MGTTYDTAKSTLMDAYNAVRDLGGSIVTVRPVEIGNDWRIAVETFLPLDPPISNLVVAGVKIVLSDIQLHRN